MPHSVTPTTDNSGIRKRSRKIRLMRKLAAIPVAQSFRDGRIFRANVMRGANGAAGRALGWARGTALVLGLGQGCMGPAGRAGAGSGAGAGAGDVGKGEGEGEGGTGTGTGRDGSVGRHGRG